jgi:hypothetical protein
LGPSKIFSISLRCARRVCAAAAAAAAAAADRRCGSQPAIDTGEKKEIYMLSRITKDVENAKDVATSAGH